MDVFLMARLKRADEFFAAFTPGHAALLDDRGCSLIMSALGNTDLLSRYGISNAVLDAGCGIGALGVGGATVLHVLFGQVEHELKADTHLARRLIERGADINARDNAGRVPFFEVLNLKSVDGDLLPIYDLWFEQPAPDFTTKSKFGLSPIDAARKIPYRSGILARMESLVESSR
jgi:hypothetical protein